MGAIGGERVFLFFRHGAWKRGAALNAWRPRAGRDAVLDCCIGYTGTSLGLQFELVPDPQADHGFDSLLTISQLRVETPVIAVTEPGALALLALGLTAVMMLRRRRASIGYVCA